VACQRKDACNKGLISFLVNRWHPPTIELHLYPESDRLMFLFLDRT